MNDKYSEAVRATLRRSRIGIAFVVLAGAFATALVLALPMPVAARLLLATWAACTALHALDRGLRCRRLACDCEGAAEVDGVRGRLQHPCFVAPWLTVVRWRPDGAFLDRMVVVLPDMLPAEDFRRLRVLLRWR